MLAWQLSPRRCDRLVALQRLIQAQEVASASDQAEVSNSDAKRHASEQESV